MKPEDQGIYTLHFNTLQYVHFNSKKDIHCVKSVRIQSYLGPQLPSFAVSE